MIATTEIKHAENSVEELNIATEVDLDTILTELNSGLPCDINNAW